MEIHNSDFGSTMASKIEAEILRVEDFRPSPQTESRHLPPHLERELTESFKLFDLNGDGKISKEELGTVVRSLGEKLTDSDLEKLMKEVDADGDGYIDIHEFIDLNTRAIGESQAAMEAGNLRQAGRDVVHYALVSAFNVFDIDKNGFISAEELHRVLVGLGDAKVSLEDCRSMINCVDEDGDLMVDFKEFQSMLSGTCVY